jgi:hypothetical protein
MILPFAFDLLNTFENIGKDTAEQERLLLKPVSLGDHHMRALSHSVSGTV